MANLISNLVVIATVVLAITAVVGGIMLFATEIGLIQSIGMFVIIGGIVYYFGGYTYLSRK